MGERALVSHKSSVKGVRLQVNKLKEMVVWTKAQRILQDFHYSFVRTESIALQYSDMKISFLDGFLMYNRLLYSFIDPSLVEVINKLSGDIVLICPDIPKSFLKNFEFDFSCNHGANLFAKCNEEARPVSIDSFNEAEDQDQFIQSLSETIRPSVEFSTSFVDKSAANLEVKSPSPQENSFVDSYVCDTCGSIFNSKKKLMKHNYNCHSESVPVRPFVCKICDKSFKYKSKLEEHSGVHTEEKFVCCICGTKFKHQRHLNAHKKKHSSEAREKKCHLCEICEKEFQTKYDLTRHLAIHNKTVTFDFLCYRCKKRFSRKDNLLRHAKKCDKE